MSLHAMCLHVCMLLHGICRYSMCLLLQARYCTQLPATACTVDPAVECPKGKAQEMLMHV